MEVLALENRPGGAKFSDLQHLVSGARGRKVYETGDVNAGVWSMSPVAGLIDSIPSCEELIRTMVKDAEEILLSSAAKVVKGDAAVRIEARL